MTHLWTSGDPITVTSEELGVPTAFTWHGQVHPVERIANRWRVDEVWWTARVWRDYFKLTTTTGWLVIVYCDLEMGGWYLQRLYN